LAEYIVKTETAEPYENPLMRIIGLAGMDAGETDFSDGKDEEYLRQEWSKDYERFS
jgi:hypothetical protein